MKVKDIKNGIRQGKGLIKHWERSRQKNYIVMYEKPLKDLIELAQKQVPITITFRDSYECPKCKRILEPYMNLNYCDDCGQAIRWKYE